MRHLDRDSTEWRNLCEAQQRAAAMQQRGETNVELALQELNASTVASVPGARYAGITQVDEAGVVSTLGATHEYPRVLDDIQREVNEGPCLSAAWENPTIQINELQTDLRWPKYRAAVLECTPIRAVMSIQLSIVGKSLAALNFHSETPGAFNEESVEIGLAFAGHTAGVWNSMQRERQFRTALNSRDVIGQAKGMLMERYDIDAVAAFELLRKYSQDANVKLIAVAQQIVAAGSDRR